MIEYNLDTEHSILLVQPKSVLDGDRRADRAQHVESVLGKRQLGVHDGPRAARRARSGAGGAWATTPSAREVL